MTAEMSELSIEELRATLLRDFEHVAESKGLGFNIDVAPGCPEVLVTDPQRLGQILKNLLANAFKFTERGDVHIRVGLAKSGWSDARDSLTNAESVVSFAVRDTGIGIDEPQQNRIFEAFAQGDGTTARLYGGTGLGLSISRELVTLLDGEITVRSAPGKGSTFTVYLPSAPSETVELSDAADLAPAPSDSPPADVGATTPKPFAATDQSESNGLKDGTIDKTKISAMDGMKILVVDDDFRNIFALSALLERGHADVTVAESGADALAALERVPGIDVVLMDIMMPIMDGYETMRAIRAIDEFKDLPIIAVTGKVMAGERKRCIDAGANDYVPKPVDTAELLAALRPWLPTTAQAA
jgi:CheY-like chemotaxis protein